MAVAFTADHTIQVTTEGKSPEPVLRPLNRPVAELSAVLLLAVAWLLGLSIDFVNLSSLSQFYALRLSRTYLRASKPDVLKDTQSGYTTSGDDDLPFRDYAPHEKGGPLHLVNMTLNETIHGKAQVTTRDRHGLAMSVGPAGVSVGISHHALWDDAFNLCGTAPAGGESAFRIFENTPKPPPIDGPAAVRSPSFRQRVSNILSGSPESLTLAQWVAISGAAVAPGMGAQTSLGVSLLLGIANVRLGYWWTSGIPVNRKHAANRRFGAWLQQAFTSAFPVQGSLMQELFARFYGPHQSRWYLSDGGHFENMAVYELVRRRVPIIIACDDGADPEYTFDDLANLTRKARLDFCAEITVLRRDGIFVSLDDLRPAADEDKPSAKRRPAGRSKTASGGDTIGVPVAAGHYVIAKIKYDDPGAEPSILVVAKPTLTRDLPIDVLNYAKGHETFPQETTANQFFDESQWESYRRLGEHIGKQLDSENLVALLKDVRGG